MLPSSISPDIHSGQTTEQANPIHKDHGRSRPLHLLPQGATMTDSISPQLKECVSCRAIGLLEQIGFHDCEEDLTHHKWRWS